MSRFYADNNMTLEDAEAVLLRHCDYIEMEDSEGSGGVLANPRVIDAVNSILHTLRTLNGRVQK